MTKAEKEKVFDSGYKCGVEDVLDKVFGLLTDNFGIDEELAVCELEKFKEQFNG